MTARTRQWRIGALAALLALVVRLAVPIGFMPMAGAAALMPCPAQGALAPVVTMPAMHGMYHSGPAHDDEHGHPGDRPSCPFAGVAAAADVAAPLAPLLSPLAPVLLALTVPLQTTPGLGLAAPPPPKTGPPAVR